MIRPLRNQILIRPILENSFTADSNLVMPDSAKKSTVQGSDGSMVHFVKAEVIAVGPGRPRVDSDLIPDVLSFLYRLMAGGRAGFSAEMIERDANELRNRIESEETIPVELQPGDTILYHPSVRNFDDHRSLEIDGVEHFIIGEHSLLAKVEP